MYRKKYHIHFVGIGGIGMSGISEVLLSKGYLVSGSDLKSSDITRRLAALGGIIHEGHFAEHATGADVVVVSSAVASNNPEVVAARNAGIPVIARAEMLAELMRLQFSVAVAGSHGKTTTTSMVATVLAAGGLDPTVVVGGKVKSLGTNAVLGQGDYIVAEADESDGSFLKMSPTIAVVTNIDREHMDFYADLDEIKDCFARFLERLPFYGLAVLCLDCPSVQDIIPTVKRRMVTYGFSPQADFSALDVRSSGGGSVFAVSHKQELLGEITLGVPGRHNVSNALAAVAVGLELSVDFKTIAEALSGFQGVGRRLELKGERNGVMVIDDYGHHPTEIAATFAAIRDAWPRRRLVVVFQPHRYSRTKALFEDFSRAFYMADKLIMLPIYAASEKPMEGVDSRNLCASITRHGHKSAVAVSGKNEAIDILCAETRAGDMVLTLGAGDVWQVGAAFLEAGD